MNDGVGFAVVVAGLLVWAAGMMWAFWSTRDTNLFRDYAVEQQRLMTALHLALYGFAICVVGFVLGVVPHLLP